MKKIFLLIIIFLSFNIFCDEYNVYDISLIKTFTAGYNKDDFQIEMHYPSERGPKTMAFDKQGNIYIPDPLNEVLKKYNSDYKLLRIYNKDRGLAHSSFLFITNLNEFINYYPYGIQKYDKDGNGVFNVGFTYSNYRKQIIMHESFYFDNTVYIELEGDRYISIENPVDDSRENLKKIIDESTTMRTLKKGKTIYMDGISKKIYLDDKNRLFLDDQLITHDYKKYYTYWEEKHNVDTNNKKSGLFKKAKKYTDFIETFFVGKDDNDNIYWYSYGTIIVFNRNGEVIDIFQPKKGHFKTWPIIHPSGDVYFLDYDEKGVYLYRVKNVWDPKGRARWYRESGVKDPQPISQGAGNKPLW